MMKHLDNPRLTRRQLMAGAAATAFAGMAGDHASAKAPMVGTQAPAFYRFRLGSFELTVLSDGPLQFGPPQAGVFSDTTKDDMMKVLVDNHLPTDNVALSQNALMVNTGNQLILIDTGLGAFKMAGNDTGQLPANLKAAVSIPKTSTQSFSPTLMPTIASVCSRLTGRASFPTRRSISLRPTMISGLTRRRSPIRRSGSSSPQRASTSYPIATE